MRTKKKLLGVIGATVLLLATAVTAIGQTAVPGLNNRYPTGNVIFIHPDGTGANHWNAGRVYWYGPDALSPWDRLPEMALYRGHHSDQLTGTSNGGATVHAFGYKVVGPGSYGKDGGGDNARSITSLSGYSGSIMREAANAGHPVGVVNDGDAAEPGTGVFLTEVGGRDADTEIARQLIDGRPGANDRAPFVVLGGGEAFFLPQDTPRCTDEITPDCAVHVDPITAATAERGDGRNLIKDAVANGWTVIRTRAEFDALWDRIRTERNFAPRVLGLFAADDIFNDVTEEQLIAAELINPDIPASDKRSNLIFYGDRPGTLGFNPPTAAEMTQMALTILERQAATARKPFMLVTEVESTDNLGNNDNAIGTLMAIKHANDVISAARSFQERVRNTLILTAADSDAGGMQIFSPPPRDEAGNVTTANGNPTGSDAQRMGFPLDGHYGRGTHPFTAAPDSSGRELRFAVGWIGTPDVAGGIISRAQGQNAELLRTVFNGRFDNTDVYRMMYLTLFGRGLPDGVGKPAPDRE
jgi:alkaline phosphatase